jgi:hypothetical protein
MNFMMRKHFGDLGSQIVKGKPIKPIKQLIKENFYHFAMNTLKLIKAKKEERVA